VGLDFYWVVLLLYGVRLSLLHFRVDVRYSRTNLTK
jgi:hypothetical protein